MSHRDSFQHGDFIPDLIDPSIETPATSRIDPTMCSRPAIIRLLITFAA